MEAVDIESIRNGQQILYAAIKTGAVAAGRGGSAMAERIREDDTKPVHNECVGNTDRIP